MRFEKVILTAERENVYIDAYIADPIPSLKRKALLVIPGGGYGSVCANREGEPIAMAFMPYGYNAFVLHYTVDKKHTFPTQVIEAATAIKYIKDHADEFGIDPDELFTVGFSAGGHLSASSGVFWKLDEVQKALGMPHDYIKPKGSMLIYPVITPKYHNITFNNLWATDSITDEQASMSDIAANIDSDSSPAFIVHTANDEVVNINNALSAASAYAKAGVPFELHVFPDAPHGVALGNKITECGNENWNRPAIAEWVKMAAYWAEHI